MKPALVLAFICLLAISVAAQQGQISIGKVNAVAIASNQYLPKAVAVDKDNVYWVSDAGSTIKRISKDGGVPMTIATGRTIDQIFLDDESVFFNVIGEIRRVSKNGGNPVTLVKSDLIGYQRFSMVVDKTNFYYYEEVPVPPGTVDKNPLLRKVNKKGGTPVTLSSRTYMPGALATDGANVYWADLLNDTVKTISVSGGRVTTLGRCRRLVEIVVDATDVYCKRITGGIVRLSKAHLARGKLAAVRNDESDHRADPDKLNLYVLHRFKGIFGIYRIAKTGGQPQLLARLDSQFAVREFAVDETSIYWTDEREGTVMRLGK